MKRSLWICLVIVVLSCGALVRPAEAGPPGCGSAEFMDSLGWTKARRQADPEGFYCVAIERLKTEAEQCDEARRSLKEDIDRQTLAIDAKTDLWRQAEELGAEFRRAYRRAKRTNQWPVKVRDAEYPEERLASQVSMLMKEAEGMADCVAEMKLVRERAEAKLEEFTGRAHVLDGQISMCTAKFELWKASRLEAHGEALLAALDQVIIKRPPLVFDCPHRTKDGFACIPVDTVESHPNGEAIAFFLTSATSGGHRQRQTTIGEAGKKGNSNTKKY